VSRNIAHDRTPQGKSRTESQAWNFGSVRLPWYEAVTHASREAIAAVAEVKVYDPFFLANGRDGSLWEHMP